MSTTAVTRPYRIRTGWGRNDGVRPWLQADTAALKARPSSLPGLAHCHSLTLDGGSENNSIPRTYRMPAGPIQHKRTLRLREEGDQPKVSQLGSSRVLLTLKPEFLLLMLPVMCPCAGPCSRVDEINEIQSWPGGSKMAVWVTVLRAEGSDQSVGPGLTSIFQVCDSAPALCFRRAVAFCWGEWQLRGS